MDKSKKKSRRRNRKCTGAGNHSSHQAQTLATSVSQCSVYRNIKTSNIDKFKSPSAKRNSEQVVTLSTQLEAESVESIESSKFCVENNQDIIVNFAETNKPSFITSFKVSESNPVLPKENSLFTSGCNGSSNVVKDTGLSIDLDNHKMTTVKTSKSNFKLNPEAAVFAPSKKTFCDTTFNSATATAVDVKKVAEFDVKNESDKDKEKEQRLKSKAERKALFEAQRAKEKSQTNAATEQKSKAELKAERRALQEAQRAAKNETKAKTEPKKPSQTPLISTQPTKTPNEVIRKEENLPTVTSKEVVKIQLLTSASATSRGRKVQFFSHLQQYKAELPIPKDHKLIGGELHPEFIRLGQHLASGTICGSNARCVAFLHALKQLIIDYVTPSNKELSRDLEENMKPHLKFLQECRPISVSMENAIWTFKRQLTQLDERISDHNAKQILISAIDNYVNENVCMADEAIADFALTKIKDDDVILTFAHSSVVNVILKKAQDTGTRFRVIITDSRPKLEGLKTMSYLVSQGINCTYTLINALSHTMHKATKVLLGAHALLANGYVVSRVGTAQVALMARAFNVPVLVCCETHKFSERVQTDSFVYNELGNPDDLVLPNDKSSPLFDWRQTSTLDLLHLLYDVTPPDLVSAVVTELGLLPCTSVPVVLRLKRG